MHKVRRRIHIPRGPTPTIIDAFAISLWIRSISSGISPKNTICGRKATAASAAPHLGQILIDRPILDRLAPALAFATRLRQFPMHVQQSLRSRPLMQIVHILRAQKEPIA